MKWLVIISLIFSFESYAKDSKYIVNKESIEQGRAFIDRITKASGASKSILNILSYDPTFRIINNIYNMSDSELDEIIKIANAAEREVNDLMQSSNGKIDKYSLDVIKQKYQPLLAQRGISLEGLNIEALYSDILEGGYTDISQIPFFKNNVEKYQDIYNHFVTLQ